MKKLSLVFVLVLSALSVALAQTTVTGTVTDQSGEPLIGASVLVKGTSTGTVTDFNGDYSLTIQESYANPTLVISYTGFNSQEIEVGSQTTINVTLEEGITLSEAVVTALGIEREKKSLGYATQEVDGEAVSTVKDVNFINSLSGKVAGLDVKRSNTLGGSANVVIRGYKSLTGNNQALFVVDGTPISNQITNTSNQRTGRGGYDFGNAAMDINPEDILSINVLKGAAATALYGSRAANGVILITTKKGAKGKGLGVTVNSGYTIGRIDETTMPVYQKEYGPGYAINFYTEDGFDFYDFFNDGDPERTLVTYEDASYGAPFDPNLMVADWRSYYKDWDKYEYGQLFPYVGAPTDPNDFYETAGTFNTNVSIDGGGDNSQYRLSYTYYDQSGILPNSEITRNSVSFSGGYNMTDKLKVTSSLNYVFTEGLGRYGTGYDNRNPNQSFRQWYQVTTDINDQRDAYFDTGRNISWNPYGPLDPSQPTQPHYFDNPYFNAYENYSNDDRSRIFGNIQLDYALTDWLNITGRITTDRYSEKQEERIAVGSVDVSRYGRYNGSFYENNFDLFANVNKDFGDKFNLGALLGTNIRRSNYESIRASTNGGLVGAGVYALSNSVNPILAPAESVAPLGVNGYYASASFGYGRFLYLDVTGRYDISSTLPEADNAYFYPSASLSFVFSELINSSVLDFGKFRLNYAEVGADAPPLSIRNTFNLNTPFNGNALASFSATEKNPELRPESTESYEAGLELRFLRNRLGLDLSVYESNTFDQIIPVTVSPTTGNLSKFVNAGQIQNRGVEVALTLGIIASTDFNWDMNINWSRNQNEVIELFGDQTNLQLASVQGGITVNATIGEAYGAIWGTNHIFDDNGSPIVYPHPFGGVRYRKTSAPEVIGDINPDWRGGINNRFRYKDLALSFLIDIQEGGNFFSLDTWYGYATGIYAYTAGQNRNGVPVRDTPADGGGIFIDGAVVQTGTDENGVAISDGTPNTEAFYTSDVYSSLGYVYAPNALHVYDASFVKLRELALTYSLPASIVANTPFQGLDVSLIGRNLWIISKNTEYSDPEAGLSAGNIQGYQSGAYPAVKEYGFNIRLRF